MENNKYRETHNKKLETKGIQYRAVGHYSSKNTLHQEYLCLVGNHEFIGDRARIMDRRASCPHCLNGVGHRSPLRYIEEVKALKSVWTPLEDYKGANTKIKHMCNMGHIREVIPASILNGSGCAVCSGVVKKTTEEYEKELFDKGLGFTICDEYKGANKKIKHQCLECNNVWEVQPHDILHGNGCPKCAKSGFNPYKPAKIYYVKLTNEEGITFYKIGVTSKENILHRFRAEKLKVKLLWEKSYKLGSEALKNEQLILSTYFADLVRNSNFLKYGGNTELFNYDVLDKDEKVLDFDADFGYHDL